MAEQTPTWDTWLRWPDPDAGPWRVLATWATIDDRPELVGLHLWKGAEPDLSHGYNQPGEVVGAPEPINATDFRRIRPRDLLRALHQAARAQDRLMAQWSIDAAPVTYEELYGRLRDPGLTAEAREALEAELARRIRAELEGADHGFGQAPRGVGRRPEYGPDHWAEVAAVYLAAYERGEHPTKAVREHFHRSASAAAKWVARCREAGLLEPTRPGHPSGARITRVDESEGDHR